MIDFLPGDGKPGEPKSDNPEQMFWKRLKQGLGDWLNSPIRERQRILWLLPLLAAVCLLFVWQDKPRFERSFTLYSDALADARPDIRPSTPSRPSSSKPVTDHSAAARSQQPAKADRPASVAEKSELFAFDPNTIGLEGLVSLGFSPKQARVILNYRAAGAVFRRPEDFSRCYTVSAEKYAELAPYIRIEAPAKHKKPINDSSAEPASSETPVRPATANRPATDSASTTARPAALTELNTADSAALVALRGIGPLSAGRILRYRERLGGFARPEQLREVQGMLDENYQLILQQIFVDSSKIQKIDINFASPERMARHPYLPPRTLDKILKNRQLKGGWSSTRELVEQHILSGEQAARLAPYLCFGAR